MVNKLTGAPELQISKVITMTDILDEQIKKAEFLNRVADITAKIGSAVDDLIMLTDCNTKYFNDGDAVAIRNAIDGITNATSLVLIDAISVVAPEELDNIKPRCSFPKTRHENVVDKTLEPEILSNLPEAAADIVELIGISQAMRLFKSFGGTTFPIGKGVRFLGGARANALRTILTEDEIRLLQKHFSGEVLYLPRCDRLLRDVRNRQFLNEFSEMREAGATSVACMSVLPLKYGFTDRYGWQLLKNEKESQSAKSSKIR